MNRKSIVVAITLGLAVSACEKAKEPQPPLQAPERAPMALDPNPPMSSADIDAIVRQHVRSDGAAAPKANTGNTSDANIKGK